MTVELRDKEGSRSARNRGGHRSLWERSGLALSQVGVPVALLLTVVIGISTSSRFLTSSNLLNILNSAAILGLVALPMTYVLIVGGLADLSIPATMATGAIVTLSTQGQLGTPVAMLLGLTAAAAVGIVNGFLVAYLKANSIIVTLAVNVVALGLAQAVVGGNIVYTASDSATKILRSAPLGIPIMVLIFALFAIVAHLVLARTTLGRWMYAVGSNYAAAEAGAIPAARTVAFAFVSTAFMGGLAGCLLALQLGQVRPGIGVDYEFAAITAVVVGGTSLLGGAGSIPRTIGGLLIIQTLINILSLNGVPTPAQGLAKGGIIVAAAAVDSLVRRRFSR